MSLSLATRQPYRTSKVFVPGGLPVLTYYPRKTLELENKLKLSTDNLCKLVMVTGSTKSGKTVLTSTIFNRSETVWFDGGSFSTESDFWIEVASQLEQFTDITESEDESTTDENSYNGEIEKNLLIVKLKVGATTKGSTIKKNTRTKSIKGNPKTIAINALIETNTPLIIDDFHYIPRTMQGSIVRALKGVIFQGVPVIFLAIPHRRLDAIKVEKEMTGRLYNINVPVWEPGELAEIANTGFPLLNLKVPDEIINIFTREALGSPHLMQEFCRSLCAHFEIVETVEFEKKVNSDLDLVPLLKQVAIGTGKVMFDKLSKGPRNRSDRLQRKVKNGLTTDIYGLVLLGLAELKPGLERVDYEELRNKIRVISVDKPPEAHEISRVLEDMSQIASSDEASTPVLDWEKEDRILHITDPFFAYYLRWGCLI